MIGLLIRAFIPIAVIMVPVFLVIIGVDSVVTPVIKFVMRDSNRPGCIKEFKSYDPDGRGKSFTFQFSEWDYKTKVKPWLTPDGYSCDRTVDLPRYAGGQPVDSMALRERIKQLNKICEDSEKLSEKFRQRSHVAYKPDAHRLECKQKFAVETCKKNEALSLEAYKKNPKERYVSHESECIALFNANQS